MNRHQQKLPPALIATTPCDCPFPVLGTRGQAERLQTDIADSMVIPATMGGSRVSFTTSYDLAQEMLKGTAEIPFKRDDVASSSPLRTMFFVSWINQHLLLPHGLFSGAAYVGEDTYDTLKGEVTSDSWQRLVSRNGDSCLRVYAQFQGGNVLADATAIFGDVLIIDRSRMIQDSELPWRLLHELKEHPRVGSICKAHVAAMRKAGIVDIGSYAECFNIESQTARFMSLRDAEKFCSSHNPNELDVTPLLSSGSSLRKFLTTSTVVQNPSAKFLMNRAILHYVALVEGLLHELTLCEKQPNSSLGAAKFFDLLLFQMSGAVTKVPNPNSHDFVRSQSTRFLNSAFVDVCGVETVNEIFDRVTARGKNSLQEILLMLRKIVKSDLVPPHERVLSGMQFSGKKYKIPPESLSQRMPTFRNNCA
jgi:hypothetical protein